MLLLTGGTGHSGSIFLKNLETERYSGKIRCLVRKSSNIKVLESYKLDIEICVVDLKNIDALQSVMKGVETVLHIAGIQYSKEIVEACKREEISWMILVHTTGRYSQFKSASKFYIEVEDKLMEENENLTILRPTMIYGSSHDKNMWQLINFLNKYRFFPIFGDGSNLMQPVLADDLAYAYQSVLKNKGRTFGQQYNLSGKEAISYGDLLKTVENELGKKVVTLKLPIKLCMFIVAFYNFLFKKNSLVSVEQVMRMQEDKDFSWDDAKRDFGYSPTSFRDGIRKEIEELKMKCL